MAKVNVKKIREHVTQINDGWRQGAPDAKFKNITQTEFDGDIKAAAALEQELVDILAQADMKRKQIADAYSALSKKGVKVRDGVEGDDNHGPDSPLYKAMGFIPESERKSGLTRKVTPPTP